MATPAKMISHDDAEGLSSERSQFDCIGHERTTAETLLELPLVESVYINQTGSTSRVWTIIDGDDDEVRDTIYKKEKDLINKLPECRFDFQVVARRGRPLDSLLTFTCHEWNRSSLVEPCQIESNTSSVR